MIISPLLLQRSSVSIIEEQCVFFRCACLLFRAAEALFAEALMTSGDGASFSAKPGGHGSVAGRRPACHRRAFPRYMESLDYATRRDWR